jgi:site-specific DNA recombinase
MGYTTDMDVFAYLRVSGKGQVHGDGFPRQLAAIKSYAAANGIRILRVFEEKGVTGSLDGMERPAWVEMISQILTNGAKTIIVEGLDRLARSQGIQEYILLDLRKRGITLVSTKEPDLESEDPTRVMFRQIIGAVAQYEKSMIVLKLRGARQRKRTATGRCEGAKPYGFHSGEAAVLARMRELYKAGTHCAAIAARLNAEGIAPRRGTKWYPMSVGRILERVP